MGEDKRLLSITETAEYLGISYSKAGDIIRTLNKELQEKGFYTITGRISKKYLNERLFGEVG